MLAEVVNDEPAEVFTPMERFYMQAIGIEKEPGGIEYAAQLPEIKPISEP